MSGIVEQVTNVVNDVASKLANTTITGEDAGGDKASGDAVLASAAEGRRLYIGNLTYAATEAELMEFFSGYQVESTSIPKNPRTDRPVGYAFVDLSSSSDAERAIAELSGKEILDRKVSVQIARKPDATGEKADGAAGGDAPDGVEGGRRRGLGRGRGRGRGRYGRGGQSNNNREVVAASTEGVPETEVLPLQEITNQNSTETPKETKPARPAREPREPRERKERGPPADGVPSKNKVMVANLPYDLSEEKLKELFADYEPSTAKIALRPIPRFMVKKLQARNEPRKGRGFGFVTLASEEMQQRAVSEMNGKEIEGREIAVKIAIDSPDKTDEEANSAAPEVNAEVPEVAADINTNGGTEEPIGGW